MSFNSLQYIIFLPLIVILYFLTPHRIRWLTLLLASYYFYMCWKPEYIILILISTVIDYVAGIQMGKQVEKIKRRKFLILSLVTNLGLLFAFKYFNFFNDSIRAVFNQFNIFYGVPAFRVLLPVGISFYTFQTLSYSIDVYRGVKEPEKHFGIFALYVAFFPQLVAGPIERSTRLLPQFLEKHNFDHHRIKDGFLLILWGFFKKVVIADRVALVVNQVYGNVNDFTGIPLIIATYFFAFQIYCDFSGYSDIAIGTARLMGFDLMRNFDRPYFSRSIAGFWRRWHISLSSWFKDYVYIPMGGNRISEEKTIFNLFFVFLISGLWHGANWTFIIWGALHGFYIITARLTAGTRYRLARHLGIDQSSRAIQVLQILFTFHLVTFAWIFFRANTVSDAFYVVSHLFSGLSFSLSYGLVIGRVGFLLALISIGILEFGHLLQNRVSVKSWISRQPVVIRWGLYYTAIFAILFFGVYEKTEFIYFQF